ncbi:transglycosylase SLT domain-containing protein [Nocardia sp. CA-129566]|uniref:aggregation-promoting factor C-terminal-like domain-containing protein n=1 Tax=Nocardia sp. CA-129566 TaxID=3239976 RepID=UPI003D994C33
MSRIISAVLATVCMSFICVAPAAATTDNDEISGSSSAGFAFSLVRASSKVMALTVVPAHQFDSFDKLVTRESGWDPFATNPSTGAYGLGQALPPEKMATHGMDWRFNPLTQIRWTYDYMIQRYGSPESAWVFWQAHHWY